MKYIDEFRDTALTQSLARELHRITGNRSFSFMEVCGTHTMSIFRNGIRSLLPAGVRLLSGPGCPVCVTPNSYLDRAIAILRAYPVTMATFGDMIRVPGSWSSLERERADGRRVIVAYSPLEVVETAATHPNQEFIFLAVGFETTSPAIATAVQAASAKKLKNFSILVAHKTIPEAMRVLIEQGSAVDGFLCPGHVSVLIGSRPYQFLADEYQKACVISGFEPIDILQSLVMLTKQVVESRPVVEVAYSRVVSPNGNENAMRDLYDTFEPCDTEWRGIGMIPHSGLRLRREFEYYDAAVKFPVDVPPSVEPRGCRCGEVLRAVIEPPECPLFGTICTPSNPVGSCMVSSEGTCAAWHKYSDAERA